MAIKPKTMNPVQQPSFPAEPCSGPSNEICDPSDGGLFPDWPDTSAFYPLRVDVLYATKHQDEFGHIKKEWEYDRTIRGEINQTTNYKDQQVVPDQMLIVEDMLALHTPVDVRIASNGDMYSLTDILVLDIRDRQDSIIYYETAGTRKGLSTVYEVSGVLPHNSPFGVDYYKSVIQRSMHQELLD